MGAIPGLGEDPQDPLQDLGKAFPGTGLEDHVDVVRHEAEVFEPEPKPDLRPGEDLEKQFAGTGLVEDPSARMGLGGDVVTGIGDEDPRVSHCHRNGDSGLLASSERSVPTKNVTLAPWNM
jgi:hypothetical protein